MTLIAYTIFILSWAPISFRPIVIVRRQCSGEPLNLWTPWIVGASQSCSSIIKLITDPEKLSQNPIQKVIGQLERERITNDHQDFDGSATIRSVKNLDSIVPSCVNAALVFSDLTERHLNSRERKGERFKREKLWNMSRLRNSGRECKCKFCFFFLFFYFVLEGLLLGFLWARGE